MTTNPNPIDRFRLLGSYTTPAFCIGDRVTCEVRGEVIVCGIHDGPISWPTGKPAIRSGQRALIVYGDLARAVRV